MKITLYKKRIAAQILVYAAIGMVAGGIFSSIVAEPYKIKATLSGMCMGFFIALSFFILENNVFDRIRKGPLPLIVVLKTLAYSLVVVFLYLAIDAVFFGIELLRYDVETYLASTYLFSLAAIFIIILIMNINRLLGQRALLRLFIGKYHRPAIEERVVMFLDLASSTDIAEKLGDLEFHRFLNGVFFDATRAILECRGEIYKYVGDEIILTWPIRDGLKDGNCVACFFEVGRMIERYGERYKVRYGLVPRFRAGVHCGKTVVGEMGDYKREVAFLGDVMNTASRIQAECRSRTKDIIVSDDIRRGLETEGVPGFQFEALGGIALRGKSMEVELFAVSESGE